MQTHTLALALVIGLAAPAAMAQPAQPDPAMAAQRAIVRLPAQNGATLKVSTPAFEPGGDIPFENTQYRSNTFPGLAWSKGPRGVQSYAIVMQDTDSTRGVPILHWTLFNIPPGVTKLEAGMTTQPAGATYGPNYKGANQPYLGPHTPPGPKHHYHLQVLALDTKLDATQTEAAKSSYEALVAGMQGHVLASGEVVGLGQIDPSPTTPQPAPPTAPK